MNEQDHHFIDQGLDQLAEFLENELHNPDISAEIPDGAHIFHGSHDDNTFTQENVAFASKTLLGMSLGYIENAPLFMIYRQENGRFIAINLSNDRQKETADTFIEEFQYKNQQTMTLQINESQATYG